MLNNDITFGFCSFIAIFQDSPESFLCHQKDSLHSPFFISKISVTCLLNCEEPLALRKALISSFCKRLHRFLPRIKHRLARRQTKTCGSTWRLNRWNVKSTADIQSWRCHEVAACLSSTWRERNVNYNASRAKNRHASTCRVSDSTCRDECRTNTEYVANVASSCRQYHYWYIFNIQDFSDKFD